MLDGGFDRWKKEGYDIETKSNALVHANFQNRPNRKILADFKQIKSAIKNNKKSSAVIIVDSRSKSEYDGSSIRAASVGHIPSAFNIDWNYNIENNVFKDPDSVRKTILPYPKGRRGYYVLSGWLQATNSFVALKMIGYKNVKMYIRLLGRMGKQIRPSCREIDISSIIEVPIRCLLLRTSIMQSIVTETIFSRSL